MSIVTINVDIQRLNLLAQQVEQIANEQSLASHMVRRKTQIDPSPTSVSRKEVTLSYRRKKRDISQTKKLY